MHPIRRRRLIAVLFLLAGSGATAALVGVALRENINLYYAPAKIVSGAAPVGARIRAGGMVANGSVKRAPNSLAVSFTLTDLQGAEFTVEYPNGMLPDLFREGQGVLVTGKLRGDGVFVAEEVLAKHDEKYMPPELAGMKKKAQT